MYKLSPVIVLALTFFQAGHCGEIASAHLALVITDVQGAHISGARVLIYDSGPEPRILFARSDGNLTVDLPEGAYAIVIQVPGFSPWCQALDLASKKSVTIHVKLKVNPFVEPIT